MRAWVAAAGAGAWLIGGMLAQASGPGAGSLTIRLTTARDLPAATRHALTDEAGRIWAAEGVALRWQEPFIAAPASAGTHPIEPARRAAQASMWVHEPLRVMLVNRPVTSSEPAWPVAELLPLDVGHTDGHRESLAVVSIAAARQVLAAARLSDEPHALAHRRLGLVLGRAVAHEIGHYLLATRTHAARGLMRARIRADEFADLRQGGFSLDADARTWLHREGRQRQAAAR